MRDPKNSSSGFIELFKILFVIFTQKISKTIMSVYECGAHFNDQSSVSVQMKDTREPDPSKSRRVMILDTFLGILADRKIASRLILDLAARNC